MMMWRQSSPPSTSSSCKNNGQSHHINNNCNSTDATTISPTIATKKKNTTITTPTNLFLLIILVLAILLLFTSSSLFNRQYHNNNDESNNLSSSSLFTTTTTTTSTTDTNSTISDSDSSSGRLRNFVNFSRFRIKLPRFTAKLKKINEPYFDPMNRDYWFSIAWICLLGIILTVAAFLFTMTFQPLRQCGLFGGFEPMDGCFRCRDLNTSQRRKPYHRLDILSLKMVLLVLTLIAIGSCITGAIGNQLFHRHFRTASSSLRSTGNQLVNRTETVYVTLTNYGLTNEETSVQIEEQIQALNTSKTQVNSLVTDMRRFNVLRFIMLYIIMVFVVLAHLLVMGAALFHTKTLTDYASKASMYVLVAVWFLFTAHFAVTLVLGDACTDMDSYVNYKQQQELLSLNVSSSSSGSGSSSSSLKFNGMHSNDTILLASRNLLNMVVGCAQPNGTLIASIDITDEQMNEVVEQLNIYLHQQDPANGNYSYTLYTMDEAKNLTWVQADTTHYNVVVNITNVIHNLDDARMEIRAANQCEFLDDGYRAIRSDACVGLLSSSNILWISFLVMSVAMTMTAVLTNFAYKRFRKRAYVVLKSKHRTTMGIIHVQI